MKSVQAPILVGVVGLVAAAALVIVPLTDDNGATSPGLSVGETTAPAPDEPESTGEGAVLIRNEDGTVSRRGAGDLPTSSASLEEKPAPRPAGGSGSGGGGTGGGGTGGGADGSSDVCEWDDGEWECDDDDDDHDDDDGDDDDDDDDD